MFFAYRKKIKYITLSLYMSGLDENGEIKKILLTPKDSPVINYGFDVTSARHVTEIITNKGAFEAKFSKIKEKFNKMVI